MAADPRVSASAPARDPPRGRLLLRAPPSPVALGLIGVAGAALAALLWLPSTSLFLVGYVAVILVPSFLGVGLTPPLARALGGRFEFHRSAFLMLTVLVLEIPLAAIWRGAAAVWPNVVPDPLYLATFLVGPAFWFRHLTLYGVSRPSHARTLAVSLSPIVLYLFALYLVVPPTLRVLVTAAACILLAFSCAVALLHAADRPIRREFRASGVAMIRPLLDHVAHRDPLATRELEAFFLRTAVPANLKVRLLAFYRGDTAVATVALPTVHPGPFAALGASDLPRKFAEQLGAPAGTVLVPHTPSDHDLDLPSGTEVDRVGEAARRLFADLPRPRSPTAGPLIRPYPGSLARAQVIGDVVLVTVTQAPAPTDDIAYSVADRIVREVGRDGGPAIALIDAHNSYIEGEGDIIYGTPVAEQLFTDVRAAAAAARAVARPGPIEVGVAERAGYSIGRDGIGPQGMRALVVRAGGRTTGYLLIDGNNLVVGLRDPIVKVLEEVVDNAEVLTTDNHVVHEVDGGVNPVGERYARAALLADAREVLARARAALAPVEPRYGEVEVPAVRVLGPGHTARLLTSLGDTLSMFTNMFPATLLLLLTSSLLVIFAIR